MKDTVLRKTFDKRLINTLRCVADYCCGELRVTYKTFRLLYCNDTLRDRVDGYVRDGHVRIGLRNAAGRPHTLRYLIDTTVHEIIHLQKGFTRHTTKFWACHARLFKQVLWALSLK